MNLDGIMIRIAKVTLSNARDVLGNVGHECQGIIVWRFVCRCACLQTDFLVCALAQTLLGPWSKDRPREYARPGIAKRNKTEEPIRTKTSHAKHARTAETATWKNMARARANESDNTLLRSIGYVC